jgi:hypothetical protein
VERRKDKRKSRGVDQYKEEEINTNRALNLRKGWRGK